MYEKLLEEFGKTVNAERILAEGIAIADEKGPIAVRMFTEFTHPRPIYSHTKSYMSTAVGIAVSEGKLSLSDRPAEFFPDKVPEGRADLYAIELRHLLTMSGGFNGFFLGGEERTERGVGYPDYIAYLFRLPLQKKPGEAFCYNNGDSYLAGKMLEKAVGMPLKNYLYEKLFSKMEMGFPAWDTDPEGSSFGASGLYLSLPNMMKLGCLFLAEGKWKGEELVPSQWVREASAMQIDTGEGWGRGYGYQWWRSPYPDSYRADGAYGQVTTVLPKSGLVVSIQCPEYGDFGKVRPVLDELIFSL